jgi:hypothetical protein
MTSLSVVVAPNLIGIPERELLSGSSFNPIVVE